MLAQVIGILFDSPLPNLKNMNLQSPTVTINKSANDTFNYLTKVKNFKSLMPENISKFEVLDNDTFVFALKGMPEITLKKKEAILPNKIVFGAAKGKIDFSLTAFITAITETTSEVQLAFNGEINAMMAMMIKKPISKFLETLANNLPLVA